MKNIKVILRVIVLRRKKAVKTSLNKKNVNGRF